MFFTDDLAFSCTKPTNIYTFQDSLGFFSKNPTKNAEQKNMPGHVLRELHRFLERNKKHAEQNNRKKHTEQNHTRSKNKMGKKRDHRIIKDSECRVWSLASHNPPPSLRKPRPQSLRPQNLRGAVSWARYNDFTKLGTI